MIDWSGLPPAVLLGGANAALSAARSLNAVGVRVHGVGHATDPLRWSRSRVRFIPVAGGQGLSDRYLEWLERREVPGAVVLPCDDPSLELVGRSRARLVELGYRPVEANDRVLLAMLDKQRTYALARQVGVPVPRTLTVEDDADVERALDELEMPWALKPVHSHRLAQHFGAHRKLFVIRHPRDLDPALAAVREHGVEMLATELIPGPDHSQVSYYSYIDDAGRPLFDFTKAKIRQYPISSGWTCYQVTRWCPEAAELGRRFFHGVGLRGAAYIEFKRDARDGRLKLIECNHRFAASNELVTAAGVDVPLVTYARVVGQPPPPVTGFREGLRMWNVIEDVRALPAYRRRGDWTAATWVRSLLHRQHFPIWRANDPLPSAVAAGRLLARGARRSLTGRRTAPEPVQIRA